MESTIGANESVSTVVRRAVSAVTGRHPDSIPPLTDALDPDALDALFEPRADGVPRRGGHLSFIYGRCRITIDNGEFLTIDPVVPMERRTAQTDGTDQTERTHLTPETHPSVSEETPGSRICFVCQQPIDRENIRRERGELVHPTCRGTLRGFSLGTWFDRPA